MALYSLEKLNSSSFESLVKSLAVKVFGAIAQVYPSGPDAGRDFAFDGDIQGYEGRHWSGLTILQAKFKEELRGNRLDIDWLEKQLEGELKKYEQNEKHPYRPKYYIIATNVNLSGADSYKEDAQRSGGLTKIGKVLDKWKDKIELVDYDIWSAEKIQTLLSLHEDVRRSYSAWITTSDVLNSILRQSEIEERSLLNALKLSLCHCLKRDKNVRLKDAGSVVEDNIRSSQVFVDLPAYDSSSDNTFLLTRKLIELSKGIFKPSLNLDQNSALKNKVLLLGGPGQGKSTASLFLTQLFRASLLRNDAGFRLDEMTSRVVGETFDRAEAEGISISLANRFPFYISLPHYADKISEARKASQSPPSLMKYITAELVGFTDVDISISNMRKWISDLPWVIVLDGLDEVPPTGERIRVIEEIDRLVLEAENLDGDVFFVATSRPQGYNFDLDPQTWKSWRLSFLGSDTAIRYAKLLTGAYYKDDPDRQQRINSQLEASFNNDATSNLMSTPLQVTILNLIVDIGGGIPTSRWNLFNEYFEILKRRERSKPGHAQEALVRNHQFIGPIHQRAGLVLHIAAENAGSATSHLDQSRFSDLIRNYLESEGFGDSEVEIRSSELSALSLNRLVLLSSREEGRVSFDVRSLQEYMAASAITSAEPSTICDRLEYLAGKSHWQHVITIAASRCFSEEAFHHSRSAITNIPRRLDQLSHYKVTGQGPKLSLELLNDGIAVDQPRFRKDLAVHALELLNFGTKSFDFPLERIFDTHTAVLLHDELSTKYLRSHNAEVRAACWNLLDKLAQNGDRKALYQVSTAWPKSPAEVFDVIKFGVFPRTAPLTREMAFNAVFKESLLKIFENSYLQRPFGKDAGYEPNSKDVREVVHLIGFLRGGSVEVPVQLGHLNLTASYVPIKHASLVELPSVDICLHPDWEFVFSCVLFSKSPSVDSLVNCIKRYSDVSGGSEEKSSILITAPWVVSSVLKEEVDSEILIQNARQGLYGDEGVWGLAEERVQKFGITEEDIERNHNHWQVDRDIHLVGTLGKMSVGGLTVIKNATSQSKYLDAWAAAKYQSSKKIIAEVIAMSLSFAYPSQLDLSTAVRCMEYARGAGFKRYSYSIIQFLTEYFVNSEKLKELADLLEDSFYLKHVSEARCISDDVLAKMCAHLTLDDKLSGLVVGVFYYVMSTGKAAPISLEVLNRLVDNQKHKVAVAASALLLAENSSYEDLFVSKIMSMYELGEDWHYAFNFAEAVVSSPNIAYSNKTAILTRLTVAGEQKIFGSRKFNVFKIVLERHLDSERSELSSSEVWSGLKLPSDAFASIH